MQRVISARFAVLLALGLAGCSALEPLAAASPERVDMPVVFQVSKDGRYPVPYARISLPPDVRGTTDATGRWHVRLRGAPGERRDLTVSCPEGHAPKAAPESLTVRPMLSLGPDQRQELHVPIACEPLERSVAILVKAETQPNLPILVRGAEVARTDADGLAHVLVSAPPGEELLVEISTTGAPALRPQRPRRQLRVENQDDIFVMHEKFSVRKQRARPRVAAVPAPPLPYAL